MIINKVQILVDNINSWIIPYVKSYCDKLITDGYNCRLVYTHQNVERGDVLILLSCERKFEQLSKNKFNLIVHESDLPNGKGWSPLTYQILEGKNKIPITLFEASENFDCGKIYLKDFIELNGTELIDEVRLKQSIKTFQMIDFFLKNFKNLNGTLQKGNESFYKKRTPMDSKLDIKKSIEDNFNLLRVVDNKRYPAFFVINKKKYILKIYQDE